LVECFITRRAATRVTQDVIDELTELCDEMEAVTSVGIAGDPNTVAAFTELNGRFHGRISEVADAEYAQPARHILVALPVILRAVHNYAPLGYQRSNSHHRELLEAFKIRDADWAESIMRLHVTASKSAIMDELRRTTDSAVSKPANS
jgi:DNA-binding GntR family transcriptional regulator